MRGHEPVDLRVCPTFDRDFEKEYIAQLNKQTLKENFPHTNQGGFLLIRNRNSIEVELHARVFVNNEIEMGSIGLDFTLRTAIGAPSDLEVKHGEAGTINEVEVSPIDNPEDSWWRRRLNESLGVRPQVCRVRMGVFPDLEDKVCRLPPNTLEMIGVNEGDNVIIESPRGEKIVRGIKAFEIDEERRNTKEAQKERDDERYPSCENLLNLDRIRLTEVDIPEIWIDQETRSRLGLQQRSKSGVCQPVRVYRDSWYVFQQQLHEFSIPLVIVLFAAGLEVQQLPAKVALWVGGVLLWISVLLVGSRSRL